jgi:hypothetical protein
VLEAIRENESRARACGYDVARTALVAFVVSGPYLPGGLLDRGGRLARELAHGEQRALEIAMALARRRNFCSSTNRP